MASADNNVVRTLLVPIDAETEKLLQALARDARKNPALVAGALLRDVLVDDALAHRPF
jgi:hypothetical protein